MHCTSLHRIACNLVQRCNEICQLRDTDGKVLFGLSPYMQVLCGRRLRTLPPARILGDETRLIRANSGPSEAELLEMRSQGGPWEREFRGLLAGLQDQFQLIGQPVTGQDHAAGGDGLGR